MIIYFISSVGSTGMTYLTENEEGNVSLSQLSQQEEAAISLPASLFELIDNQTTVGVFYAFYKLPTLFPIARETQLIDDVIQTQVGTPVIASTVVSDNVTFDDLSEPVTVLLRLLNDIEVSEHFHVYL